MSTENEIQAQAQADQFAELDKPDREFEFAMYGNYEGTSWYCVIKIKDGTPLGKVHVTCKYDTYETAFAAGLKMVKDIYKTERYTFHAAPIGQQWAS